MPRVPFLKMQGLGNDFIVFDEMGPNALAVNLTPAKVQKLCDRRLGIGADQILVIRKPVDFREEADARMDVWNADGSIVEMCGNGIRAIGLYLSTRKTAGFKTEWKVETLAGLKTIYVSGSDVRVNLGEPKLSPTIRTRGDELDVVGRKIRYYDINLGNPHAVVFMEDHPGLSLKTIKQEEIGARMEKSPRFPNRTNVEFVEITSRRDLKVDVWERGAGWTLACGTGACAAAVAAIARGKVDLNVRVNLPGGQLRIEWAGPGHPVWMQGPANEVYSGDVELD